MNVKVLSEDVQRFINSKLNDNITKLALSKNPFSAIEWRQILNQISGKKKAQVKLPTWYNSSGIYYPEKVSLEQSSSEDTAKYKSQLIRGKNLIDLSGGFGVDDYYFSEKVQNVIHCELNPELSAIVSHNYNALKAENISCIVGDSSQVLKYLDEQFSWIYVDPSRRHDVKGKVFLLKDCVPNVPDQLEFYYKYSTNLLVKSSPLLDISAGLAELKNVKQIHVVAVKNEVKELLWVVEKGYKGPSKIIAANIIAHHVDIAEFTANDDAVAQYGLISKYLYEPNAAILKAGAFSQVAHHYNLTKLHLHSHLYTSEDNIQFPGRKFVVNDVVNYTKSEMKQLVGKQMNVTTRNFPDSVEQLRKKWKLKEGGDCYCFFTTDINENKIAVICSKI